MKSLRTNSQNETFKISVSKPTISFNGRPTPLDFDSFIPWFCLELQVSKNVVVTRTYQAEYINYSRKASKSSTKLTRSKSKSNKIKVSIKSDTEHKRTSNIRKVAFAASTVHVADAIPVTTCYDKRGRLIEISIVGCRFKIPRKVIQAFNLCLPFHSKLSKLSIRKGGLCHSILYEISKLLPHSNITEICLDDSHVPEGSYSILLDRPSQIKYLSLKRCCIKDEECKKIAEKMDIKGPAVNTLLLLDLTSNNIMDVGARALGEMLKTNRHLMYLNLAGNKISDVGASSILQYLQEFPLTFDDIKQRRGRYIDYLKARAIVYEKCLKETKVARLNDKIKIGSDKGNVSKQSKTRKSRKCETRSFAIGETSVEDESENKTKQMMGEFEDPFKEEYVKQKDDTVYAIGNLTLTYLNLAYNNLSLLSVRRILKTLQYQSAINELTSNTGLVKVVIDGNNIPSQCNELYEIDIYLRRAFLSSDSSLNFYITSPSRKHQ